MLAPLQGAVEGAGCREAEYLAGIRLPGGGRLVFGAGGAASAVPLQGGVCIVVPSELAEGDVESSVLGELYASLLLAAPESLEGRQGLYWEHVEAYAERVAGEENWRLRRVLGELLHGHAYAAPIGLLVARMSRLARLYVWLRPVYNETIRSGVRHLHRLARVLTHSRWLRLSEAPMREPHGPLDASPRAAARVALEAANLDILRSIPAGLLLEGFSTRPLPPLRDPLLYVRLDAARLATRLIRFEDQLYALTNVAKLLRLRRSGLIRSTRVVETGQGFRPAVVKHYRDPTMAKWLLAAILSLPLPKPRIAPKQRLNAEYHYNRVLASRGYPVPDPILVDPRRMKAAYTYVEGKPLSAVIQEEPATPAYRSYGALLARLHGDGISVWDTNPSNALISSDGAIYLVDLEQAREARGMADKAWDIAVAAYYSIVYTVTAAPQRAALLAQGYIEAGGDPAVVAEASKYRYAAPFAAATPPNVLEKTRRALAAAAARQETP